MRTAVLGMGTVAPVHLQAIAQIPELQLVATADLDPTRNCPGILHYPSAEALLADENLELDAVHLCLPHDLHYPIARLALARKLAVFTEKPVTESIETAKALCALSEEPGAKVAVCFQNRLNPCTRYLLQALKEKRLGELEGLRAHVYWARNKAYYEAAPWRGELARAGSGSLINQAIHTLDLMQLAAGAAPVQVSGQVSQLSDLGTNVDVEDTAVALVHFANGLSGFFCSTNCNRSNAPIELIVYCEKGEYQLRGPNLYCCQGNKIDLVASDSLRDGEKNYYGASHAEMIKAFYAWLQGDQTAPVVSVAEAMVSLRLIEAIKKSQGQPVPYKAD